MKTNQAAGGMFLKITMEAGTILPAFLSLFVFIACPLDVNGAGGGGIRTRVVTWGNIWAPVPADLTNAVQISAGDNVGMAATADKRLVIWGNNYYGQLDVPPDLTNIVAVAAGNAHCLALRDDGTVVAWGSGKTSLGYFAWPENGQSIIPPGLSDVKAIVASFRNSLALRSNGTVVCWGNNEFYGQNNVPVSVNGSTAIACYQDFCLALKTNGTVVRWGATYSGLGSVPAGLNGVMDITCAPFRGLVVKTNGTAAAWGTSYVGEGVVPAGMSGLKSLVCGSYHNLGLRTNGTVVAWGGNSDGQTNLPPGLTNVLQISARGFQSMALIDDSSPNPPVIATQPQNRTNNAGTAATFNVVASVSGTPPFTYQWLRDGTNLTDGPAISGTTTDTLSLFNVQSPDAANYSVVISNDGGSVTSSVVNLTVMSGTPIILTQPADTSVLLGVNTSLSVAVGGSEPLFYQWFKNGTPQPVTTNPTLSFYGVQESDGGNYFVVANNALGSVTSSVVALVVESCIPRPSGLVAWWRGEGNSLDSASNNAASGFAVTYPAGQIGQCLNYDGLTSSLIAPASPSLAVKSFTFEGWVYPTDGTPRPIIEWAGFSGQAGVQIWVNKSEGGATSPGALYIGLRTAPDSGLREMTGGYVPLNQWTHIAVSVSVGPDGTGIFTYINGNWQGGRTYIVPFTPNTSVQVNLGSRPNSSGEGLGGRRFLGKLDELSLYNRTLTDQEVWSIYLASSSGKCVAGNQPFVLLQPTNVTASGGANVSLACTAGGALPLSYQWRRDNMDLPGATSSTLNFPNVQVGHSGTYSVLVSNAFGTVLSSNATLTVLVPAITNVAPLAGIIGDVVTIRGLNFSSVAASNVVRFGAVRAVVLTAGANQLTVAVPAGATYGPVSVTVDGLVAMSTQIFQPSFVGNNSVLSQTSFAPGFNLTSGSGPFLAVISDLDGDGKPDLTVDNAYGHNVSLFRNLSTVSSLDSSSFGARVDLPVMGGPADHNPYGFIAEDLTGDGKPELIIADRINNRVLVYPNLATPGTLDGNSFGAPITFATSADPRYVRARDLDGDGRPDLVTANYGTGTISVLKNIGAPGTLDAGTFATHVDIPAGTGAYDLVIQDLDGDGKPDIAVTTAADSIISVFRNVATPGILDASSFAPRVDLPANAQNATIVAGDLDGDGRPELIAGGTGQIVSVYRNRATPGSLTAASFAPRVDFGMPGWVHTVALADLDGSQRPEIVIVGELGSYLAVMRNQSEGTPGTISTLSFSPRVDFPTGWNAWGVAVGDLDADGRPDIVFNNSYDNTTTIYHNQMPYGGPPTIVSQPSFRSVVEGNNTTFQVTAIGTAPLIHQWRLNGTNIPFANEKTYTVVNATVEHEGNYSVFITNSLGAALSSNALLTVLPAVCVAPSADIAGWWRGESNTLDYVSELAGTLQGDTRFGPGKVGAGFVFDGNGDGVQLGNPPQLMLQDFTIEAWIKRDNTNTVSLDQSDGAGAMLFAGGSGGYALGLDNAGQLFFAQIGGQTLGLTWPITDTFWHHVGVTKSGTDVDLYFDGVWFYSLPAFNGTFTFGSGVAIGTRGDGAGNTFQGAIDEVTVYRRALTLGEMQAVVGSSFQGKCLAPLPPFIVAQPQSLSAPFNSTAVFSVAATGSQPLRYQWFGNGIELPGQTNALLTFSNVQFAQSGSTYFVTVTNDAGGATSSVALLTVPNTAPQIVAPANLTVDIGSPVPLLNFSVNDLESNPDDLTVLVSSSNSNVVNQAGLVLGGTGTNRTLAITPLANRAGLASIRLTVIDPGGLSNVMAFSLNVNQFTNADFGASGVVLGALAWGDYDNDGDLDLIQSGTTNNAPSGGILRLFRNDGGVLNLVTTLPGLSKSTVAWADYNSDGFLDLLVTGQTPTALPVARIYRNNRNGTFTDINAPFTGVFSAAAAWTDFDNDGDADVFLTGMVSTNLTGGFTNVARLYRNDGSDKFVEVPTDLPAVSGGGAAWADYDKDGWQDVVLTGTRYLAGTQAASSAGIYRNLRNGSFALISTSLIPVSNGFVSWGDADNDGDLDLVIASATGGRYYRNDGGGSFSGFTVLPSTLTGASGGWGDYDNDGDLDFVIGGAGTTPFQNFGNGNFSPGANLLNSLNGASAWGDYDNDGDLDLAIMGTTNGGSSGAFTMLVRNLITVSNAPPAPPQLTSATTGPTNSVTLLWQPATDSATPSNGLSYNLRLGTTPGGGDIISPLADPVTGFRRVVALGNADSSNRWTILNLPAGTYYWSVQAIDGAFVGSPWGEFANAGDGQFEITNSRPVISPIADQITGPSPPLLIPFTIGDVETGASNLLVSARSSNTNIVPNSGLVLGGFGSNRTVTVTAQSSGQATVTLTVRDASGAFAERAFLVNFEQFTLLSAPLPGVAGSIISWADFDNDGDLDVLVAGLTNIAFNNSATTRLYRNDGAGNLSPVVASFPGISYGSASWGDFDNDGDLDLLLTGSTNGLSGTALSRLYRNDGPAGFTNLGLALPGVFNSAVAWADYDNDGDLDFILTGQTNLSSIAGIAALYRNQGNGSFVLATNFTGLYNGSVAWGDYDGDGDLDLLMTGQFGLNGILTVLQRNNGNGTFTQVTTPMVGAANGSIAWGDCDGDGDLDVLLSGYNGTPGTRVYLNFNNGNNWLDFSSGLPNSRFGSAAWGDFDNDGRLDILLSGSTNSLYLGASTRVLRNSGQFISSGIPSFTNWPVQLPPNYLGQVAWADFDNDGDLDISFVGADNVLVGNAQGRSQFTLIRNNNAKLNTPPTAPTNLVATFTTTNVILSWAKSTDAQTTNANALKYQIRVGTTSGGIQTLSPQADLTNGFRRIVSSGTASTNRWRMNLPPGDYYWSVQAIDTAFAGSPFSVESTFSVTNRAPFATNQVITMNEDTNRAIVLTGSDPDSQPLTFVIVDPPTNGVLTGVAPNVVYRPNTNYFGSDNFRFKVTDGQLDSAPATVSLTISAVNDRPSFTRGPDITVLEDAGLQVIPGWATDISPGAPNETNQVLSFRISTRDAALFSTQPTISADGTLRFQFGTNANGTASLTVRLKDDVGTSETSQNTSPSVTLLLTATPVNDAPAAFAQALNTPEDTPRPLALSGNDIDGDSLVFLVVTNPAHGTLSGVAPNLVYTPSTNYYGPDSFAFVANDGQTNSAPAVVNLVILPVNDAPVARITISPLSAFPGFTNLIVISLNGSNAPITLDGSASSDAESDPLTYSWREDTNVIASAATATVELTVGTHTLTLEVSDATDVGTATAEVEVVSLQQSVGLVILLLQDSGLDRTTVRPLTASLKAAAAAFDDFRLRAGSNQLDAFQNQVRARIEPTNPELAAQLIAAAQVILDVMTSTQ